MKLGKYVFLLVFTEILFCQEVWPLSNSENTPDQVTSAYGPRDKSTNGYDYDFHWGLDLQAYYGQPVYASFDGIVEYADVNGGYGDMIRIRNVTYGDGAGYTHLSVYNVIQGDTVLTGDLIGWAGESGIADGPHLHFNYYQNVNNQYDLINSHCWHPLNYLYYGNDNSPSPEITNATCDNNNNVTTATVTVQTAAAELDFIFFQIDVWPYSKLINFDLSSEYRTDNNPITISLDPNNSDNTRVSITTTPLDFNYQTDNYQVINFTLDFSQWNGGTIYAGDLCFYVGDVEDAYNDYNEQDTECSFSAAQNLKKTISLKELEELKNE